MTSTLSASAKVSLRYRNRSGRSRATTKISRLMGRDCNTGSALEVVRDLRLDAQRAGVDGIDRWTRAGAHVGTVTVTFSDSQPGQLGTIPFEEHDLHRRRVEPILGGVFTAR